MLPNLVQVLADGEVPDGVQKIVRSPYAVLASKETSVTRSKSTVCSSDLAVRSNSYCPSLGDRQDCPNFLTGKLVEELT